jgi:hypothetical protein
MPGEVWQRVKWYLSDQKKSNPDNVSHLHSVKLSDVSRPDDKF